MTTRRPRSVLIPLGVTLAILLGLTLWLARFDERMTVRITSPTGPFPLRLKAGAICAVEGIADAGDAVYARVNHVMLALIAHDARYGKVYHGTWVAKYDPASKTFSAAMPMPRAVEAGRVLYLGVEVNDTTGRTRGDSGGILPDEAMIPVVIE